MTRIPAQSLPEEMASALEKVAREGDRIILEDHGREVAMLISMQDAALLEEVEDLHDLRAALEGLREEGELIPLEEIKKKYGA
ncbi:MAG TPA: type II toxin-antitoxin system Phd/YefM family antitoxin [bacterium]|nr:type II toxin-antitoxin system Phd/YefM family antitoxin [bacterium]